MGIIQAFSAWLGLLSNYQLFGLLCKEKPLLDYPDHIVLANLIKTPLMCIFILISFLLVKNTDSYRVLHKATAIVKGTKHSFCLVVSALCQPTQYFPHPSYIFLKEPRASSLETTKSNL